MLRPGVLKDHCNDSVVVVICGLAAWGPASCCALGAGVWGRGRCAVPDSLIPQCLACLKETLGENITRLMKRPPSGQQSHRVGAKAIASVVRR